MKIARLVTCLVIEHSPRCNWAYAIVIAKCIYYIIATFVSFCREFEIFFW